MTFLSPLYLWFLPLVAVPVIIHLLAKRKSRLIEFPSLIFLKKLEQDALRKFNIKQLLLLIIRSLIVLFIILAFARPSLNNHGGFGIRMQKTDLLVILIDNTASTREIFSEFVGPWLDELKSNMEDRGTEVWFCEGTTFQLYSDHRNIVPSFDDIHNSELLESISEQQDISRYRKKSLIWLGDGQDASDMVASLSEWDIYLLDESISDDHGVLTIDLPRRVLKQQETYAVSSLIGRKAINTDLAVELYVNDTRVNQTIVEPGKQSFELAARVLESGAQEGVVVLDPDAHPYNDQRFFVLEASTEIPLQIVGSGYGPNFWEMTNAALGSAGANLSVNLLPYERIDELNTGIQGTIIIDDAGRIPEYVWLQLDLFLRRGGQLVLFGNGGPSLTELLGFTEGISEERSDYSYGLQLSAAGEDVLKSLPIQDALEQNRLKVFERTNVGSGELDRTWIRFLDDQPFLGVKTVHHGQIVWFNTSFSLESTNLPLLGIFPTLILELGQSQVQNGSYSMTGIQVGDTLTFIPQTSANTSVLFSIQRPDGTVDFQQPDSSFTISYSRTDIPGIYRIQRGREVLDATAVNISTEEAAAHQAKYPYDEQLMTFDNKKILHSEVLERSTGVALWPVLLLLLLLLWLAEIGLSRIRSTWRTND